MAPSAKESRGSVCHTARAAAPIFPTVSPSAWPAATTKRLTAPLNRRQRLHLQRPLPRRTTAWARKEAARRRTEQHRAEYTSGAEDAGVRPGSGQQNESSQGSGLGNVMQAGGNKVLAALCYLSFLFVIPWIFTPTDKFATYHAKQGLILFLAGVILDMIGIVAPLVWIFRIYLIYKGMYNALNGIKKPLPLIGRIFGDT